MDLPGYRSVTRRLDHFAHLGDRPDDDPDLAVRKRALALTALGLVPATLAWVVAGLVLDRPLLVLASLGFAAVLAASIIHLARSRHFDAVVRTLLLAGLVYVAVSHVALGGFVAGGGSLVWGVIAPVSAVLYLGPRSGLLWLGAFAALVIGAVVLDGAVRSSIAASWPAPPVWLVAYNILGPALIVLLLTRYIDGERLAAQRRSSAILLDVMPATIVDRLAGGDRLIAERHESVSVLFADVVDFTPFAERTDPGEIIQLLNALFSAFDRLAKQHGVEKIKTTGDGYMAVAGAPIPRADHADAALRLALAMHAEVRDRQVFRKRQVRLRIGIASGPVIAGVIGRDKPAYDLWGDTVNVASRMESSGSAGSIQVTPATHALLSDSYLWRPRHGVPMKGKGEMTTYVLDAAAHAMDDVPADADRSAGRIRGAEPRQVLAHPVRP
ncbi:MAG TPA: adenylate/guanylate cyclase domain-containing protein [Candidatus Limnocylindria bacterium]|nr:adenylate/guanylate cyclase domain-containing protein [Candidatus Limnocylindria bacterium]